MTTADPHFLPTSLFIMSDITILDKYIFTIKHRKLISLAEPQVYRFQLSNLSPYQPLTYFQQLRQSQHASPSDLLFITKSGSHLRQILSLYGYPADQFSGLLLPCRSCINGNFDTASQSIQLLARWSSQASHSYICSDINIRRAHNMLISQNMH